MYKYGVPSLAFVNKMDRAGANYLRCVNQIRTRLQGNPVVIQLPIGAEERFEGVVDLVRMKAIHWDDATEGMRFEYRDIPADMLDLCKEYREKMIEAAAEADEELLHTSLQSPVNLNSAHPVTLDELLQHGFAAWPVADAPFEHGGFPTPSGKCEFVSDRLSAMGLDPLPDYIPNYEQSDEKAEYPLAMISPPARNFSASVP